MFCLNREKKKKAPSAVGAIFGIVLACLGAIGVITMAIYPGEGSARDVLYAVFYLGLIVHGVGKTVYNFQSPPKMEGTDSAIPAAECDSSCPQQNGEEINKPDF